MKYLFVNLRFCFNYYFISSFQNARQVYFELDLADHSTMSSLAACRILPSSQHLSGLLPSDLYFRLRMHLERVRQAMPGWITEDQKERGEL